MQRLVIVGVLFVLYDVLRCDTSLRGESFKDARLDFRVPTREFFDNLHTFQTRGCRLVFNSVLPANGVRVIT